MISVVSKGRRPWLWLALGLCLAAPARSSGDMEGAPSLESFRADAQSARDDPASFFDGERAASAGPSLAVEADASAPKAPFPYLDSLRSGGPLCCEEAPAAGASSEPAPREDFRYGAVLDAAPAAVESVSILSTTVSAAGLSMAAFGMLGGVLGALAAALVAVGVAQAGYELYRKYKDAE